MIVDDNSVGLQILRLILVDHILSRHQKNSQYNSRYLGHTEENNHTISLTSILLLLAGGLTPYELFITPLLYSFLSPTAIVNPTIYTHLLQRLFTPTLHTSNYEVPRPPLAPFLYTFIRHHHDH